LKLSRQALTELKHYSEDTFIDETHLSIIHGKVLLLSSTFQLFSRVLCHNSLGRSSLGRGQEFERKEAELISATKQ
jgi:hypothetical protein